MANLFPKWTNTIPTLAAVGGVSSLLFVVVATWYYATPDYMEVGYQPIQPLPFSHQIHAGMLGMDCRYCHTDVEQSHEANIPTTSSCMNCHAVASEQSGLLRLAVSADGTSPSAHWTNPALQTLRTHHANEEPIPWRRVHKVPDYAHFRHNVHIQAGVSCYSCHQRIDQMPVVYQAESLGMGWCLDCHRNPEENLVPREYITDLRAVETMLADRNHAETIGRSLAARLRDTPAQNCAACHH